MEENLKTKHIITIPEGCIAQIDDNKIIIKEKQPEFKDGDILICDYTGPYNLKIIMIYKGSDLNLEVIIVMLLEIMQDKL